MGEKIQKLRELVAIQGSNGNYNYDAYMHGMYNGMELALAMMEDREPVYKEAPGIWLADMPLENLLAEEAVQTFTEQV